MKNMKVSKSFRLAVAMMTAGSLALAGTAQADEGVPGGGGIGGEGNIVVGEGCAGCPGGKNGFFRLRGGGCLYDN